MVLIDMPSAALALLKELDEVCPSDWPRFEKEVCCNEATDCKEYICD